MWHSMIAWILARQKISALERRAEEVAARFEPQIERAREDKDYDGVNSLHMEMLEDQDYYRDQVEAIRTQKLLNSARALSLDIPWGNEEFWERSRIFGHRQLTAKGFQHILAMVRLENRERREPVMAFANVIVSILSLAVAILALIRP